MYSTRIHESTISRFVPEVCHAIYKVLKIEHLSTPDRKDWLVIAEEFETSWQFPNCIGALDGRHIKFRAPISAGSYYYNYKGDHFIVLLAMADAKYKIIYCNVGANGRTSDGGVFRESGLFKAMSSGYLLFPQNRPLSGRVLEVPYVIVVDDAFPLSSRIMKPFPCRGFI
ncbi:hypothetical protein RI129_003124 [Pyrocoelia pectoralis]|uniref:DDE Tnp4 domain-containing protein n=1 Tax=Pyrocoelia pectoralis TaxID=417401 RepID=A0AAN7ZMS2_9COLE